MWCNHEMGTKGSNSTDTESCTSFCTIKQFPCQDDTPNTSAEPISPAVAGFVKYLATIAVEQYQSEINLLSASINLNEGGSQ